MTLEEEHSFPCPFCWQTITILLDMSVSQQDMVQDCEVCCRPMRIVYSVRDGELESFDALAP
jgi:hypothetical protein